MINETEDNITDLCVVDGLSLTGEDTNTILCEIFCYFPLCTVITCAKMAKHVGHVLEIEIVTEVKTTMTAIPGKL